MGARIPEGVLDAAARKNMMAFWEHLCADRQLAGLPYKFETMVDGKIIMSPASLSLASFQGEIVVALHAIAARTGIKGKALPECPVLTADGIKSPDVAWLSSTQLKAFAGKSAAPSAPVICIGVKSSSNSSREMDSKRALYFAAGATEVWICDERGAMSFWGIDGKLKHSVLFASFPKLLGDS